MKKYFLIFIATTLAVGLKSQDFQVGNLYYNLIDNTKTVEVCKADLSVVSVAIPSVISINDSTEYTVVEIASEAFYRCDLLESVIIPSSVTSIRPFSFYNCKSLMSIVVDAANPKYDSREDCNAVIDTKKNMLVVACKNSTIPHSVIRIKEYAFAALEEYSSIHVQLSGVWYFDDCLILARGLDYCAVKEGTRLIADDTFSHNDEFSELQDEIEAYGGYEYFCEGCDDWADVYDALIYDEDIYFSKIEYSIYAKDNTLYRVVLPDGIESIGARAFAGAELRNITIPSSVVHIGEAAFYDCDSLESVELPDSVATLEMMAFDGCSNLKQVTIGNSIKSIERYTFNDCKSLSEVHIGSGVVNIDRDAFSGCDSLRTIYIPSNVKTIVNGAFPKHTEIVFEQE